MIDEWFPPAWFALAFWINPSLVNFGVVLIVATTCWWCDRIDAPRLGLNSLTRLTDRADH